MSSTSASGKSQKHTKEIVLLWFGVLVIIVLPSFLYIGEFCEAIAQHGINQTYIPVEATIISAEVHVRSGRHGNYYTPNISFQYQVNGKTYVSKKVTPAYASHTRQWTESLVSRFKHGQTCQVFRDPTNPAKATLIKGYTSSPYVSMLTMVFAISAGAFMLLRTRCELPRKPVPTQNGWFEMKPMIGQRDRLRMAAICTTTWYMLSTPAALHYFSVFPQPTNDRAAYWFIAFALIGFIPVGFLIRYILANKNLTEARLLVDKPIALLGDQLRYVMSQSADRQFEINKITLSLRCIKIIGQGKHRTRHTVYEKTDIKLSNHTLLLGQKLNLNGELIFPSDQRPSGRDEIHKNISIKWELILHCDVPHAPDYHANFLIQVEKGRLDEANVSSGQTSAAAHF